jgi:transposase
MDGIVGVDVSKARLDVALLSGERVRRYQGTNDAAGHRAIGHWLARWGVGQAHICLEATGAYGFEFACLMAQGGHRVSLVNPAKIEAFRRSELLRSKTDKVDAGLIARFCRAMTPPAWTPPRRAVLELRALVRRCAALKDMRTQEINRLKSGSLSPAATTSVERLIAVLEDELETITAASERLIAEDAALTADAALLRTVPGIGPRTAAVLLGELPDLRDFAHPKKLAAFVGIAPSARSSGERQGSGTISRVGNGLVRSTMVLCALSAKRYNPITRAFAERLAASGKPPKVVLVAVAKKLLFIAHGVLKHGRPFDPAHTLAHMA